MAVSMRKKKSFNLQDQSSVKMCFRERDILNMASAQISWPTPMRAIGAQNLLTMPGGVSESGYLHKKGGSHFSLMKWPLRFVILHKGCVYYFKSSTSPSPQGAFSLNGYNRVMRAAEETTSNNVFPFKIVHFSKKHRTWYFSAACEDERKKWMLNLRREIDYYYERREGQFLSASDSDTDSFYGSIESPLDIKYVPNTTEDDYMEEDEEDEEEDYLKPDGEQTSADRPPPAYPPPPVPMNKPQLKAEPSSHYPKGLPLPVPPVPIPPPPLAKKPTPPIPLPKHPRTNTDAAQEVHKGPPPPVPFAPHLQKARLEHTPLPPKPLAATMPHEASHLKQRGTKMVLQSPATLPICTDLEKKLALRMGSRPGPPALPKAQKVQEEMHRPGMYKPPLLLKPQGKPVKPKNGPVLPQSSPDGQSFRSTFKDTPVHLQKNGSTQDVDSDEDYENVQLPDSVFIDTTDTSCVEKLFKGLGESLQDGLYCFRNSGTKTSKVLVVWDMGLKKARNYRVFEEDSRIFLDVELTFPSLAALVEYYYSHPLPNHLNLLLQKPYGYFAPR